MSTTCGTAVPTGTSVTPWSGASGKAIVVGCASSPVWVPSPASGTASAGNAADCVLNDRMPSVPPAAAGVKVTAAFSLSPLARATGNVTGTGAALPFGVLVTWPTVNWLAGVTEFDAPVVAVTPVTVTAFAAVMLTVLLMPELTRGARKGAGVPVPGAAAGGAPNPYT